MFSRFLNLAGSALILVVSAAAAEHAVLRVCADPNNLPFSNQAERGFENRLASLVAAELGEHLEYTWWAERKSFLRNSLQAGKCDAVMGVPAGLDSVAMTRPYYRSTYVIVTRADSRLHITSLLDEALEKCRIGIHVVGDDYAPPAQVLARRGLAANIVGYSLFGADGVANPPAKLIDAVRNGDVDVAIVWGPFAGFFARNSESPLDITPVSPSSYLETPFTYEIAIAVRKEDAALRDRIDAVLTRKREVVRSLLDQYGVPVMGEGPH